MESINVSVAETTSGMEDQIINNVNHNISQDITMDASYGLGYRSPCNGIQNHGLLSPGQGRSVREFEEQLDSLRKENFNLKLRIYVLEEKLPALDHINTPEGQESLAKQCLESKVETEILKNDLEEKKQLLREAAEAINHMEFLQKEADERNKRVIDDLRYNIQMLEHENKTLEKSSKNYSTINDESKTRSNYTGFDCSDNASKLHDLETSVKSFEEKIKRQESIIHKKNKIIEELQNSLEDLKRKNSALTDSIETKDKSLNMTETKKLQNDLYACRSELANKICELDEIQEKMSKKNEDYEKALQYIEKLIKVTTVMQTEIDQIKKESDKENEANLSNASSTRTTELIVKKQQKKIESLSDQIDKLTKEINIIQSDAEQSEKQIGEYNNVCNILTIRLEELAGFLDSLLKNKDVLKAIAPERKREIQNAVNRSLDLSRSFTADSLSITNLSFDDSNLAQLSNITGILENSRISKNSDSKSKLCETKNKMLCDIRAKLESFREKDSSISVSKTENSISVCLPVIPSDNSESEVWSEPDRKISMARIGLHSTSTATVVVKNTTARISKSDQINAENSRSSDGKNKSKPKADEMFGQYQKLISEKDEKILEIQCQLVEADNRLKKQNILFTETTEKLKTSEDKRDTLELELENLRSQLGNIDLFKKHNEKLELDIEAKNEELNNVRRENYSLQSQLKDTETRISTLENQTKELTEQYEENINSLKQSEVDLLQQLNTNQELIENLKKSLDKNLVSLSNEATEKAKLQNEKQNLETYIQDLLQNCESLRSENNLLIYQINGLVDKQNDCHRSLDNLVEDVDDKQRQDLTSPDLGIESETGHASSSEGAKQVEEAPKESTDVKLAEAAKTETVCPAQLVGNHKCEDIQKENLKLRTKYKRLTKLYLQIIKDIKKTNTNMSVFERNVKDQIQKTNVVLEYVRNNFAHNKQSCTSEK